jgi:hypothetical protein
MSVKAFGLAKRSLMSALLALALGLFCARGQEKKAETASSTVPAKSTETSSKVFKQNGLNELEKSIFGTLKNFGEDNGSDILTNRKLPRSAPAPSKQTKEILERRKNWAFMTPEELVLGRSTLEAFDLEGTDKSDESKLLTPMERYYQRLLNKDSVNSANQKDSTSGKASLPGKSSLSPLGGPEEQNQDDALSGLPASVRDSQRALRANKEKEKKEAVSEHHSFGFFTDVFALERKPSLEEQKQERERLDAYRKSLGLDTIPRPASPFGENLDQAKDPYRITVSPAMMSLPTTPAQAASPAAAGSAKGNLFAEPAPKLAGSPSLSPAPPKIDPPRTVSPPNPTFAAPRRVF